MSWDRSFEDDAIAISDDYHFTFVSWVNSGVFARNKKAVAFLVVAAGAFLFWVWFAIVATSENDRDQLVIWWPLIPLLASELIVLMCFQRLKKYRRMVAVERVHSLVSTDILDIKVLKKFWFNQRLGVRRVDYLDLSREFEYISNRLKYRSSGRRSVLGALAAIIFEPGAKSRVISLLISLGAILVALSIRNGASLNDVFVFFEDVSSLHIATLVVYLAIGLISVYALAVVVLQGGILGLKRVGYVLNPEYSVVNEKRVAELSVELALLYGFQREHAWRYRCCAGAGYTPPAEPPART